MGDFGAGVSPAGPWGTRVSVPDMDRSLGEEAGAAEWPEIKSKLQLEVSGEDRRGGKVISGSVVTSIRLKESTTLRAFVSSCFR